MFTSYASVRFRTEAAKGENRYTLLMPKTSLNCAEEGEKKYICNTVARVKNYERSVPRFRAFTTFYERMKSIHVENLSSCAQTPLLLQDGQDLLAVQLQVSRAAGLHG